MLTGDGGKQLTILSAPIADALLWPWGPSLQGTWSDLVCSSPTAPIYHIPHAQAGAVKGSRQTARTSLPSTQPPSTPSATRLNISTQNL